MSLVERCQDGGELSNSDSSPNSFLPHLLGRSASPNKYVKESWKAKKSLASVTIMTLSYGLIFELVLMLSLKNAACGVSEGMIATYTRYFPSLLNF